MGRAACKGDGYGSARRRGALVLWLSALVLLFAIAAEAQCGGHNQRACCVGEAAPCQSGNTEVNGCAGIIANCDCGGGSVFDANSHCRKATPCGGVGQRACCGGELIAGEPCAAGLFQIEGCTGDCFCGGSANPFSINSSGTCIPATPCGAKGQRACCASERFFSPCDAGLIEVPGCSGDCFCKNGKSSGMCTVFEPGGIVEPGTGRIQPPATAPTTAAAACPLLGYADLHVHMFAEMAHGGAVLAGKAYANTPDPFGKTGINQALEQDFTTLALLENSDGEPVPAPALCPPYVDQVDPNNGCRETFFHGDHDPFAGDPVGSDLGTHDGATSNLGVPIFNGWPRWSSTTHQQTYYKWLERAWQGGLRLITMLAVTNEALCRGNKRLQGTNCLDSMAPIDAQLDETKRFESFIDQQYGTDAENKGWFRIVYSPAEAREVIAQGKLAVVLGIEVAELFNCKFPIAQCPVKDGFITGACTFSDETNGRTAESQGGAPACTPESIRAKVEEYYDLGVRHVFPVHNFDNAFGGAATWQDGIEVGNRVVEDHWWETRNCWDEGYGFGLGFFTQSLIGLLKFEDEIGGVFPIRFPILHADCNQFGLFPLGRVLIDEMMDKGMLIDVDHVSNHAFDDILDMAEAREPDYPVVATHVLSFDLHTQDVRHERHRTRAQLERIRGVGGMIAAMLKDEVQDTGRKGEKQTVDYAAAEVRDDCRYSSKTFAQAYAYAVDVMGSPVAMGSDFNGVAGHFGPRFGSEACGGDFDEQKKQYLSGNRLEYPFALPPFGTFDRQTTGHKTFDYNVDGMAHIGLLPDFVADLQKVGMAQSDLNMLNRSAEGYIRVWERAAGVTPAPEAPACRQCTGVSVGPSPLFSDTTLFFSPTGLATVGATTVAWDFGDGATGGGAIATHSYECPISGCPATFTVRATVTDQFGSTECTQEVTVQDSNDTFFGAQLAIDAPDETPEGSEVEVRFRHSILWSFVGAGCGATGVRTHLEATNALLPLFAGNEYLLRCYYPGGVVRDADIFATVAPLIGDAVSRTEPIRVLNLPPVISAGPVPAIASGLALTHAIALIDVPGDVLTLEVHWGDGESDTYTGLQPGPFELEHTYLAPSRVGQPYRIELALSDDVDTDRKVLEVDVLGSPPVVTLSGDLRVSLDGTGRYEFYGTDPDGGTVELASLSCGDAAAVSGGPAITNHSPPNPTEYAVICGYSAGSAANPVTVTMVDDEQRSASKTVNVVVGTPPSSAMVVDGGLTTAIEGMPVRFIATAVATDGDAIDVDSVTCDGNPPPQPPVVQTVAAGGKVVELTCIAGAPAAATTSGAAGPPSLSATVVFSDRDGAATAAITLAVEPLIPDGGACAEPIECESGFCVAGVCCDTACSGPLQRCNLPGREGSCVETSAPAPALSLTALALAALSLIAVAALALRRLRPRRDG